MCILELESTVNSAASCLPLAGRETIIQKHIT